MTTIVTFKSADGIVLAADSAMTTKKGRLGANRYDSYEKLNQLGRLPVVVAMWGNALTDGRTVRSILWEFAAQNGYDRTEPPDWTLEHLARGLSEFILKLGSSKKGCGCPVGRLDLLVSGYSSGRYKPEQWHIRFPKGTVSMRYGEENLALAWDGVNDAIRTLWWGYHPTLRKILAKHHVSQDVQKAVVKDLESRAAWGPDRVDFTMPLADAARLVEFLVWVQIHAERFSPGPPRTAPPVDVVAVRYDGVHWLRRKSLGKELVFADTSVIGPA